MDEIILLKECLSDTKLKQGRKLLSTLDDKGYQIEAAYWIFMYERNNWRLHIVSAEVDRIGKIKAYRSLNKIAGKFKFPISFQLEVSLDRTDNRFFRDMMEDLRRDGPVSDSMREKLGIGDDLVDVYIYRLPALAQKGKKHGRSSRNG
jgi:hypothetical protein